MYMSFKMWVIQGHLCFHYLCASNKTNYKAVTMASSFV